MTRIIALFTAPNSAFPRYVFAGICAFMADYVCFVILLQTGLMPGLAAAFAYSVGFIISFSLAKHWVFRASVSQKTLHELKYYSLLALWNAVFSWFTVSVLVKAGIHPLLAKPIVMGVIVLYNFAILKRLFKHNA